MEKYGVQKDILHEDLRNEEGRLMMEMQRTLRDNTKTASDRNSIEQKLQSVRSKLTELDLGKKQVFSVEET
jgi:hypothetical protein